MTIMALSAGLSKLKLLPGRTFSFEPILQGIINLSGASLAATSFSNLLWGTIITLFWILLLIWLITFILRPAARKYLLRRMIIYLLLFLLIFVLMNNLPSLASWGEQLVSPEVAQPELSAPFEDFLKPPAFIANPPQWLILVISTSFIALLLWLTWFFWQRRPRLTEGSPLEQLTLEAHYALQELRAGSDLKDTIKRCYRDMSQILSEQHGLQRHNAMTPREFEQYLSHSGLRDEHIQQLTRLFESVRYGAKVPGQREEDQAITCLTAIVQTYGKSA